MSNIPPQLAQVLSAFADPSTFERVPGLQVEAAMRRHLAHLSAERGLDLSPTELDEASTSFQPQINPPLSNGEVEMLGEQLACAFLNLEGTYRKQGFHDPVACAIRAMAQFKLHF
jgi:hypothetical protein